MSNNLFQGVSNQIPNNQDFYGANKSNVNWANPTNTMNLTNYMPRQNMLPSIPNIPGRVIFSPEQISPQEIPTNGFPALFPLSDGSCIIVKALAPNGTFEEQRYVLEQKNVNIEEGPKESEFDQVMARLSKIEGSLDKVLSDLYGSKNESNAIKEVE